MLRLVHYPFSTQSRFIRLCLAEYGESADMTEAKPWERRDALLQINPAGNIPILIEDSGPAICGHDVIAEYLDETRGPLQRDHRLMPENPQDRAEVRRLMYWFLVKMEGEATGYLCQEKVHKLERGNEGGAPDSQVIRAARSNMKTVDYTGDIAWEEEEVAKAWYSRVKSRPSFRPILAERLRGLPPSSHYADLDF